MVKYITVNKKGVRQFNPSILAEDLGMKAGDKKEFYFKNITYMHGYMKSPTGPYVKEENEVRLITLSEGKSGKTRFSVYVANIYGNKKNNTIYMMELFDDETIEKIISEMFNQM